MDTERTKPKAKSRAASAYDSVLAAAVYLLLIGAVSGGWDAWTDIFPSKYGHDATARIVDIEHVHRRTRKGRRRVSHYVRYSYLSRGQTLGKRERVSRTVYERANKGGEINARVLRFGPFFMSTIDGHGRSIRQWAITALVVIMCLPKVRPFVDWCDRHGPGAPQHTTA